MPADILAGGLLSGWTLRDTGAQASSSLPFSREQHSPDGDLFCRIARDRDMIRLGFDDVAGFEIDLRAKTLDIVGKSPDATTDCVEHLLYDHVVPRIVAHEGKLVLHGSAVAINGRLAVFIGETGAGKSTLAASLHAAGHALHGDDAVVVQNGSDGFSGQSVYPTLRLYPETATQLLGDGITTRPMARHSSKRRVQIGSEFEQPKGSIPIGTIFVLSGGQDSSEVRAAPMSPGAACMALIEQSFALDPDDADHASRRLRMVSELVRATPVVSLSNPHDFATIDGLHTVICNTMASASETSETQEELAE